METKFDQRMKKLQLVASTRKKYNEIIGGADESDLLGWITRKVNESTPTGTILPMRAAVKHYLISEHGYSDEELKELLPETNGVQANPHLPLTAEQLGIYHAAVEQVDVDPAYTILRLLPVTGLRIGEITALKKEHVVWSGREVSFVFNNRGMLREVPLPGAAVRAIEKYLEHNASEKWLFAGYRGNPITPHAVRIYTRKIANDHAELEGLCPHRLRATYAMMLYRKGFDIKRIQIALGHKSIVTTQLYLSPDLTGIREAFG